jgi:hypothetical protein
LWMGLIVVVVVVVVVVVIAVEGDAVCADGE